MISMRFAFSLARDKVSYIVEEYSSFEVHTAVMRGIFEKLGIPLESLRMMPVDPEIPWSTSPVD